MFASRVLRGKVAARFHAVPQLSHIDLESFRNAFFKPQLPVLVKSQFAASLPAIQKWFAKAEGVVNINKEYFGPYRDMMVALEKTSVPHGSEAKSSSSSTLSLDHTDGKFERFEAPFSLFADWLALEVSTQGRDVAPQQVSSSKLRLYLAQHSITSLPSPLQADLPTPTLVSLAGKGDIYASSIWLGLSPTRTPMHKDPNPNLFVQMVGTKRIRMVYPATGRALLALARSDMESLSETGSEAQGLGGLAGMRGEEMMGLEGVITDKYFWESDDEGDGKQRIDARIRGFQATLQPGDGLFIPQGWWHSVRGTGAGLNASVNWWFR